MAFDPSLLDQIEAIEFSERSQQLFCALTAFTAADEEAAVILVAAAVLLARCRIEEGRPSSTESLDGLGYQFIDLLEEVDRRLCAGRCRPHLRVVGGLDFQPERNRS